MSKLVELIPSFIAGLVAEKNMSLNTVNSYKNDLLVFSKFLLSRDLSPLIVDILVVVSLESNSVAYGTG